MLELSAIRRAIPPRFDRCLFASGYERRARHAANPRVIGSAEVVAWGFKEHPDVLARPDNDSHFRALGTEPTVFSGNDDDMADELSETFLHVRDQDEPHVLVDISCMTRAWYGALVRTLMRWDEHERVHVTFAYTPGVYRPPPAARPLNEIVGPVRGFTGFALPDAPSVLLLGLGFEPGRAMGAFTEIDPSSTRCFLAHPGVDSRFRDDVFKANRDLANHIPMQDWIAYPLSDPFLGFHLLNSACNALSRRGQVILTNNGPKLFGLLCFLAAARHPSASVWRISTGESGEPVDCEAAGDPYMVTTSWRRVAVDAPLLWAGSHAGGTVLA
jgi:hypothetical protein